MSSVYIAVPPQPDKSYDLADDRWIEGMVKGFTFHVFRLPPDHSSILNVKDIGAGYGLIVEPDFLPNL